MCLKNVVIVTVITDAYGCFLVLVFALWCMNFCSFLKEK